MVLQASISSRLATFRTATSELVEARTLLQRVDSKFFLPPGRIPALLDELGTEHPRLETPNALLPRYRTLYFDTPDHRFLRDHFRGVRPRFKMRLREHVDRACCFIETKRKEHGDETTKHRMARADLRPALAEAELRFLTEHLPFDPLALRPRVENTFRRVTLLGEREHERLTIDFELSFTLDGQERTTPQLCIIELKQPRRSPRSAAMLAIRRAGARSVSFSKYLVGMSLLADVPRGRHILGEINAQLPLAARLSIPHPSSAATLRPTL